MDKMLDKIPEPFNITNKKRRSYMKSCMRFVILLLFIMAIDSFGRCTPCRREDHDWFKVFPQNMYPLPTPGFGVAGFHFELFTAAADGCDSFPHMYIKRMLRGI